MPSGDGLLVRLNMPGGSVPLALMRGIASCARRFGNGLIDLTRRGNLQLRGVREETHPALLEALASFAIPGATGATEVTTDVLLSPLAGIDPKAVCDILPVAAELRSSLATDRHLRSLPAKFCFIIDDGGRMGLDDIDADIRFKARHSASGPVFAVALGRNEEQAATLGACTVKDVADVAARLAHAFLDLRGEGEEAPRRMARLVEGRGAPAILRSAGLERDFVPLAALPPVGPPPEQLRKPPVGFDMTCENAVLGYGVTFGRLTADQLDAIADGVQEARGELRLTPWRVVLVAVRGWNLGGIDKRFNQSGYITASSDARLRMVACPGAPHCSRASVSTHEDALQLGRLAQGLSWGISLHVSGCAKGCARSRATKATLVGRDGRYDLVIDGAAGDPPAKEGLTLEEAKIALEQIEEEIWAERVRLDPEWEKHL
jgi:precorrin-3B synthase